jgi:hypothetical protein
MAEKSATELESDGGKAYCELPQPTQRTTIKNNADAKRKTTAPDQRLLMTAPNQCITT